MYAFLSAPTGQARPIFPFTAIVGQDEMKLALILNVIDPKIGGVMIMGDRGTGKSTTIRALADLLPEMKVSRHRCGKEARFIVRTEMLKHVTQAGEHAGMHPCTNVSTICWIFPCG